MNLTLRFAICGDRALLVYLGDRIDPDLNRHVHTLRQAILAKRHPAVIDVTPSYHALLVDFDPVRIRQEQLAELVQNAAAETTLAGLVERAVEIPVLYGGAMGPDLETVAAHTGLSAAEVVRRHSTSVYRVYCLGFSPGFCFLGGLDPTLSTPRLAEPRTLVPGGSVGIAGDQTGIYPAPSPGGWQLIGRTPGILFDPLRTPPALMAPGDTVRFTPVDPSRFAELDAHARRSQPEPPVFAPGKAGLRILQPGLGTTVQDLGRRGWSALGVSTAGAADVGSLMVGNWLLGNRARGAALEITLAGLEVEFTGLITFALTGAQVPAELITADGGSPRPVPGWTTVMAGPGDRLRIGPALEGCRTYLCVAGGIDLEPVLGSLSEDLFGKIGPLGRPLQAGDWLPTGLPLHSPADIAGRAVPADAVPRYTGRLAVRATGGPQADAFTAAGLAAFFGGEYTVGSHSDRQGLRLQGPRVEHAGSADILSEPIALGSVQVPAGGQPILLLANRQTVGGYAKVATAVFPDVSAAGQLRPGDRLSFREVDAAEATAIAWTERRRLAQIRRYLEREFGVATDFTLESGLPAPVIAVTPEVAAPDAPAPVPAGAAAAVYAHAAPAGPAPAGEHPRLHTYRITMGDVTYEAKVEEVEGE